MSSGAPTQLASARGDFASLSRPLSQTGSATSSRLRLPAQMQNFLLSARVPLGTPSRVPNLANMPRRRGAARMVNFVTTATGATGIVLRVYGKHAKLHQGLSEPIFDVDCLAGALLLIPRYL